jgi:pilus assembly protein CpaB
VRASTLVMVGFAVLFGLLAVFIAQAWLNSQAEMRMKSLEAQKTTPAVTKTIVVAAKPLRYGMEIKADSLREIPWSQDAVPKGAFNSIPEILSGGKRVVLAPIEANEPVLALKVTGAGQRATLSSLVEDGMKAVTIRVNDVEGVGGFVLPGDRVDVVLIRESKNNQSENSSDILLQHVKVLAVDQLANERQEQATIAKAVTLEVTTEQAQKILLAVNVGRLSLILRQAGQSEPEAARRITDADLGLVARRAAAPPSAPPVVEPRGIVDVVRGTKRESYNVQSTNTVPSTKVQ